ncbi:hypothetical protein EJP67_30000 [Variovorax guangxiensis]|uniref:PIN domain-containing protein n=1 Tax=Variovorax guangxiensis TaxID=1775474 RepID=A0A433MU12_9BURK|nr:hypothetical protein [Variovorax guangxiensis]RUR71286.1 hypothetical protein EJP67_30000 [Variovorax guangxiensis]
MNMQRRLLFTRVFQLDANLINAKQKVKAVNQLETWRDNGVICLAASNAELMKAQASGGAAAHRTKLDSRTFTVDEASEAEEEHIYSKVEAILWSKAANDNHADDVAIVCEAIKWRAILVTDDGNSKPQPEGIYGNREKLRQEFGLQVLRPESAVQFIRSKISERDEFNARVAALTGKLAPGWTGQD